METLIDETLLRLARHLVFIVENRAPNWRNLDPDHRRAPREACAAELVTWIRRWLAPE